jgi:hypothetical protein
MFKFDFDQEAEKQQKLSNNKKEALGRTNRIFSFDTTRTEQKITSPTTLR